MISSVQLIAPHVHLPLRLLTLCLDCDECFKFGPETCPACGSATWTSLSRFLEQASASRRRRRFDSNPASERPHDQAVRVRQLIVVASDRKQLYEQLKRAFTGNETVRVVLDRRGPERRTRSAPRLVERRQGNRRAPRMIDGLLGAMGWAIVPQAIPETDREPLRSH